MGGGLRQAALITAPARVAVEETFLGGKLKASHERAREVATMWTNRGGKLEHETETNMVWLDLEDVGLAEGDDGRGESGKGRRSKGFVEMAVERGVKVMGGRLVVHYRMCCRISYQFLEFLPQFLPLHLCQPLPHLSPPTYLPIKQD